MKFVRLSISRELNRGQYQYKKKKKKKEPGCFANNGSFVFNLYGSLNISSVLDVILLLQS